MEEKKKSRTSTAVKRRYNEKNYTITSFAAPKDLAAELNDRAEMVHRSTKNHGAFASWF